MSETFDIAVVGATGLAGEALVELLEEREFPLKELHLLDEAEAAGKALPFRGRNVRVRDVADFDFGKAGLVILCASAEVAREHVPRALAAGCSVIDSSGAFAEGQGVLVQQSVNPQAVDGLSRPALLSVPCAAAAEVAEVLAVLRARVAFERLSVTACLSASALGREGVQELARQTAELLNARPIEPRLVDRQFAFNILGQVGDVDDRGHAAIERRLAHEIAQLFPELAGRLSVNCLLAPVFFGDALSVTLRSPEAIPLDAVLTALDSAPGIELLEDDYPTAVGDAVGQDTIYVGRVRHGLSDPCELNLWIVSDNVRKGAAATAVDLAESLIKHHL